MFKEDFSQSSTQHATLKSAIPYLGIFSEYPESIKKKVTILIKKTYLSHFPKQLFSTAPPADQEDLPHASTSKKSQKKPKKYDPENYFNQIIYYLALDTRFSYEKKEDFLKDLLLYFAFHMVMNTNKLKRSPATTPNKDDPMWAMAGALQDFFNIISGNEHGDMINCVNLLVERFSILERTRLRVFGYHPNTVNSLLRKHCLKQRKTSDEDFKELDAPSPYIKESGLFNTRDQPRHQANSSAALSKCWEDETLISSTTIGLSQQVGVDFSSDRAPTPPPRRHRNT